MKINKHIMNFELILYTLLALAFLIYNVYHQHKLTVLLYVLVALTYVIMHKIIIKNDDMLINNLPTMVITALIVSLIYYLVFNMFGKKEDEQIY